MKAIGWATLLVALTTSTGCFSIWGSTQLAGKATIWDESVREEAVPVPGLHEQLRLSIPLVVETTTSPRPMLASGQPDWNAVVPPPVPRPFAFGCSGTQTGEDTVYHSAYRYGRTFKIAYVVGAILEAGYAAAMIIPASNHDSTRIMGGLVALDALGTAALTLVPRKDVFRIEPRPAVTSLPTGCPPGLTFAIGADEVDVDAAGHIGEAGDAALDAWMLHPGAPLVVRFAGTQTTLPITDADRCTWVGEHHPEQRQSCAMYGMPELYTYAALDVPVGALSRVAP